MRAPSRLLAILLVVFLFALAERPRACRAAPSPPRPSPSDTLDATLAKVVKIFGAGGVHNLEGYGTGLLVSPNGHVVTVWSHLLDSGDVSVVLNDGRRFTAKFLKGDPGRDLAVLKIEGDNLELPFFDLRDIADASPGTRASWRSATCLRWPPEMSLSPSSTAWSRPAPGSRPAGARIGAAYEGPVYIVDAVTNNPGAAGGALTTLDGRLVGMIGRELRNTESNTWINYAVPLAQLRGPIAEIIAGRFTAPPSKSDEANLPRFSAIDLGLVMVPDVVYRTPAYVESAVPGSPAAKAGVMTEDLIVFVNDDLVQSNRTLKSILGRLEPGDSIRLVVRRKEKLVPLELRVPEPPGK